MCAFFGCSSLKWGQNLENRDYISIKENLILIVFTAEGQTLLIFNDMSELFFFNYSKTNKRVYLFRRSFCHKCFQIILHIQQKLKNYFKFFYTNYF